MWERLCGKHFKDVCRKKEFVNLFDKFNIVQQYKNDVSQSKMAKKFYFQLCIFTFREFNEITVENEER